MRLPAAALLVCLAIPIAGCEQLGIETPAQQTARSVAEGKAIGSACRHAGRALEDCYQINPRASKAAIFDGWREMDAYMRENKLEAVPPEFPVTPPSAKKKKPAAEEAPAEEKKPAEKPAATAH
jgi:hypothetical protein